MAKPTRSTPQIDQEQGDSMDEGEGQEEWLSDGGYTDDDTMTQDQEEEHSATQETSMEETRQPQPQVDETVENINNQLQLEINIGEDGVAIIRRQAVRVSGSQSTSPHKVSPPRDPSKSPAPSKVSEAAAKSYALAASSASEGAADEEQDPEKLLDQLETFLIRKTDGKVLETKATVQTTLNDLVKKTVDNNGDSDGLADENGEGADDGNDTDDLLSVLDDTATRRTTRSLAKLQQADTPSTQKGKANAKTSKQVTKTVESSSKANSSMSRSTNKSSVTRNSSQDNKPVIISNKIVHLSTKSSSQKKSDSTQKSTPTKIKNKLDNSILTSPEADDDLIKHFASKNKNQAIKKCEVIIEKIEPRKPYVPVSKSNFGDTYNTFIQKKQSDYLLNKPLVRNQKTDKKPENVPRPRTYKRAASSFVESVKAKKIDPFDELLKSEDNENDTRGKSPKNKRLSIDSKLKSPLTKKPPLVSKPTKDIVNKSPSLSNKSSTVSNKSVESTNKILTILEKNSGLSVKSTSNTKISNMQPLTRKIVAEIPKTLSPKIQPSKTQSPKIQPPKTQSPIIQSQFRKINDMSSKTISKSNVSTKVRPISPLESKIIEKEKSIIRQYSNNKKMQNIKTYSKKATALPAKEESNRSKVKDDTVTDDDDEMNSNYDDHDMDSMPEWPGDDDDDDEEEEEDAKQQNLSTRPQQRLQEGISKNAEELSSVKLADDDDEMDGGSSDFDSDDMDGSEFNDMSLSDPESIQEDFFTIDLRDERATEYLPLLGSKAQEILEREKRSLFQKLSTIQQGLKSLYETTKQNQSEVDSAKLKIIELNALLRQP